MVELFPSEKQIQCIIDGLLRIVLRQQCEATTHMRKEEDLFMEILT